MNTNNRQLDSDGFTIIELMIALSVLATILLMTTVILIQINSLYSKGINSAKLQNSARTITADVQSAIQFGNYTNPSNPVSTVGPNTWGDYATCIGTVRYTYKLDYELGIDGGRPSTPNTLHVLWRDNLKNSSYTCKPLDISVAKVISDNISTDGGGSTPSTGYEMVPDHVRLGKFSITQASPNVYSVDISMAYGDDDLLIKSGSSLPAPLTGTEYSYNCRGNTGTQFCAASEINTVVTGRTN